MKFLFVQPCIPTYRVPFFRSLNTALSGELLVIASKEDVDGLPSDVDKTAGFRFNLTLEERYLFRRKFFVQSGICKNNLKNAKVVVVTGNLRCLSNWLLLFKSKVYGFRILWWGQARTSGSSYLMFIVKLVVAKLYDGMILYTEREFEYVKRSIFSNKKLTYLNNGLDLNRINSLYNEYDLTSQATSSEDIIKLVFIGRVNPKSNITLLLSALVNVDIPVKLLVIGDGSELEHSKRFAEKYKLNVSFLGSIYKETALAEVMCSSDAFVYPGAVGLSLIHAFSYRLPAIVHNNHLEHMPEFCAFENDYNGYGFERGSATSLAKSIEKMYRLKLSGGISTFRENAFQTVNNKYNVDFMANQMSKFIEEVLLD
jgi:glycosyltransferase involved in cell wall biosynthesis